MGLTLRRLPYIWAKSSQMKKTILLFALLSCWFGSAQIIEFENLEFKNYLLSANSTTNLIASTETATFNLEAAREYSTSTEGYLFIDTSVIFQVQNYYAIDSNSDGEIDINEENINIKSNEDGVFNVLVVGTRKDKDAVNAWMGVERLKTL
jgi:hypothetical protein